MNPIAIRQIARDELPAAVDLLATLNPDLEIAELAVRLEAILDGHDHYELHGAYEEGKLIGVCGAWVATKIWCGRYLEIDNLVIAPTRRASGVGTRLMEAMEALAKERACEILVLDSYVSNSQSHRLYHRLGYEIKGFHFVKIAGLAMNTGVQP